MTVTMTNRSAGFRPLFAKENRKWWGTRRWWSQLLLWVVILNGLLSVTLFLLPTLTTPDGELVMPESPIEGGVQVFFGIGAMALAIAAPVLMQDEIIGEKQSGTADWILSKPVSRSAFILSKVAAHTLAVALLLVIVPAVVAYLLFALVEPSAVAPVPFVLATALTLLHTLFYLTLALLLGVIVNNRGLVLGVALGFFFIGQFATGFIPVLDMITPWLLPKIAVGLVMGAGLPVEMFIPVGATSVWIIVFLLVALWRFQHTE